MSQKKGGFDKIHQKAESHVHHDWLFDANQTKPALQVPTLPRNL